MFPSFQWNGHQHSVENVKCQEHACFKSVLLCDLLSTLFEVLYGAEFVSRLVSMAMFNVQ